jgi:uncharacterized protein YqjF (DUF2071 family)
MATEPAPHRPWLMSQTWENLLFAHWPVPASTLKPLIPAGLELDLYKGEAWVGVVPFTISNIHLHGLPPIPGTDAFPEINVRTYVRKNGQPGVYFFSLDAQSRLAVAGARQFFHLQYHYSRFKVTVAGGQVSYRCRRPSKAEDDFAAGYQPVGKRLVKKDPLTLWLTERYRLFSADRRGRLFKGEIRHPSWPLYSAQSSIKINHMAELNGFKLSRQKPLLHFSRRLEVKIWNVDRIPL